MATSEFIPGSIDVGEDIFTYSFFTDKASIEFIEKYRNIMFIIRGMPGTGKGTLTKMFNDHYPSSVRCSASDFYKNSFESTRPTKKNFNKIHLYCHERVEDECIKGSHPIIVSNTSVNKSEVQPYLNIAEKYEYTVIVVSTHDKFKVSAEILARSNTKGLPEKYFEGRLRQWRDLFPILSGWFLSLDVSLYIHGQLQNALEVLLGDGKFCRIFNVFDKSDLFDCYQVKKMLFCLAGYGDENDLNHYFQSSKVKDSFGKKFRILIQGYLVTHSNILGIVHLNNEMEPLVNEPNCCNVLDDDDDDDDDNYYGNDNNNDSDDDDDCDDGDSDDDCNDLHSNMQKLSAQNNYKFKTLPLSSKFPEEAHSDVEEADIVNIEDDKIMFIHLAERNEVPFLPLKMKILVNKAFHDALTSKKLLDECIEGEHGHKICRLKNKSWLIIPPKMLSVPTVFTGLYI